MNTIPIAQRKINKPRSAASTGFTAGRRMLCHASSLVHRRAGHPRPQRFRAASDEHGAVTSGPLVFATVFIAPRPQALRETVQRVFLGYADRAVQLVGSLRNICGNLAGGDFRGRSLLPRADVIQYIDRQARGCGNHHPVLAQ
jgi:hypothetical protein